MSANQEPNQLNQVESSSSTLNSCKTSNDKKNHQYTKKCKNNKNIPKVQNKNSLELGGDESSDVAGKKATKIYDRAKTKYQNVNTPRKEHRENKQNIRNNYQSSKISNPFHANQPFLQSGHQAIGNVRSNHKDSKVPEATVKNTKTRINLDSKKKEIQTKKFNTLALVKELKVASKNNECDLDNVSKMISSGNISTECDVLLGFMNEVLKIFAMKSENKVKIMQLVFQKQFMDAILLFMHQKTKDLLNSEEGKAKCRRFFERFIRISELAIELLPGPNLIFLKHSLVFTQTIFCRVEGKISLSHSHFDIRKMIDQIEEKVRTKAHTVEEERKTEMEKMKNKCLYPSVEDLCGYPPELEKNIVEGSYQSTDHYLAVQFTLLHEDFIAPLREGILEYSKCGTSSNVNKRKTQVAVFNHVRITNSTIDSGKFGHVVWLDLKTGTRWDAVKRFFIFGSLLLFTADNFKSFFTGTVIKVSKERQRTVTVKLDTSYVDICKDIYATEFVMAVSKVFFEPYYHVLKALQDMASEEFPMKKYIVDVSSEPEPPAYISQLKLENYTIGETSVEILNPTWPKLDHLNLNPSQQEAFKAALTKEFVAIQGPPGTGKTFLGLQIVSALLDNVNLKTPILIVCYKNHALDQFLEGLLEKTKSIIRIGGRSKNENLKEYNLRDKRGPYGYLVHEEFLLNLVDCYLETKQEMEGLKDLGILSVRSVLPYVTSPKLQKELMTISIEDWLMEGMHLDENEYKGGAYVGDENQDGYRIEPEPVEVFDCDYLRVGSECDIKYSSSDDENIKGFETVDGNSPEDGGTAEIKSLTSNDNCDTDEFYCDESRHRIDETYIDDYSMIYSNVSKQENEELVERNERKFILTLSFLKEQITYYETEKNKLLCDEKIATDEKNYWIFICESCMQDLTLRISFLKRMLCKELKSVNGLAPLKIVEIYSVAEEFGIFALSNSERWLLYHSWVDSLAEDMKRDLIKLEESIHVGEQQLDKARSKADLAVLKEAKVVGVTTSGAARNRWTLNELGARIGDHKQLRPSPASHKLCIKYNFDVSLFERMIRNGLSCHTLDVQHRMRPEFASLIVPSIYPHLSNHATTENRPNIAGIHSNLFFVNHEHHEDKVPERCSHLNKFEAKFVLELARYLILQGYSPEDITILATYSGQVLSLTKMRDQIIPQKKAVRISTVDDFQGEENKIIILSLVRSNCEGKIGFLKTENRVCVALSRAREGLYIFGNMNCLAKSSLLWPVVREKLVDMDAIGDKLKVYCQNHKDTVAHIENGEMFRDMPEGGCARMCEAELGCGHVCKYHCHPRDQEHRDLYMCALPCERKCRLEHPCRKLCGEECNPCKIIIEFDLTCGHKRKAACSSDPETLRSNCHVIIPFDLTCGHKIEAACSSDPETLSSNCPVIIPFSLVCGHPSTRKCNEDEALAKFKECGYVCEKDRECGHLCMDRCGHAGKCAKVNQSVFDMEMSWWGVSNLHHTKNETEVNLLPSDVFVVPSYKQCQKEVEKTLECAHKLKMKCWELSSSTQEGNFQCQQEVEKTLSCGHTHKMPCQSSSSLQPVECLVEVEKMLKCNHTQVVPCAKSVDEVTCSEKIKRKLSCSHEILIKCGLTANAKSVENFFCSKMIKRKLSCGHEIRTKCGSRSDNLECKKQCEKVMKCGHVCKRQCYEPCACSAIVEKELECGHKMRAPCSSNNVVCDQPCERDLSCGHKCRDWCGVKCDITKCQNLVKIRVRPACRHGPVMAPCSWNHLPSYRAAELAVQLMKFCKAVCGAQLKCGHRCQGVCGECFSDQAHAPCRQPCSVLFPCSHPCPKTCEEDCGVCNEKCLKRCSHKKCNRNCGDYCEVCQEPCDRGCVHNRCRRPCFAICDRKPCALPCASALPCGHPCAGFCGEPCPPLCLLCNPRHPLAAQGNADRLIILEDCGHVMNAAWIYSYISKNKDRIVKCPLVICQTPIITTKRFHREVTETFNRIMKFKWFNNGLHNQDDHYSYQSNSVQRPFHSSQKGYTSRFLQSSNTPNRRGNHPNGRERWSRSSTPTVPKGKGNYLNPNGRESLSGSSTPTVPREKGDHSNPNGHGNWSRSNTPTVPRGKGNYLNTNGRESWSRSSTPTVPRGKGNHLNPNGRESWSRSSTPTVPRGKGNHLNPNGRGSWSRSSTPTFPGVGGYFVPTLPPYYSNQNEGESYSRRSTTTFPRRKANRSNQNGGESSSQKVSSVCTTEVTMKLAKDKKTYPKKYQKK